MIIQRSHLLLCTSLALAPILACDSETDEFRTGYYCPAWQCGYNTSEVNGKSIQDLNLDGVSNAAGVRIVDFTVPLSLIKYDLDTDGDALVARPRSGFGPTLRGFSLVGSIIWIKVDGGPAIPVTIAGYDEVLSWAAGTPAMPAYALIYPDLDELVDRSICKGTLVNPLQAAVIVLGGERYDNDTKTVIPDQDRWMTLACAGSAAAKMALLGYGPNGDFGGQGQAATADQRQATIKMLTSDLCGDGVSYTEDGTPLQWDNAGGTVVSEGELGELEALWTSDGALCLDTPRLVDPEDVACQLPSCAGFDLDDAEWITHLPPAE